MRTKFISGTLCLWMVIGLTVAHASPRDHLKRHFAQGTTFSAAGRALNAPELVRRFYRERDHAPAWGAGNDAPLRELLGAIRNSAAHGLSPEDYHATALAGAVARGNMLETEILATDAFMTLGAHLSHGKLDPGTLEFGWTITRDTYDGVRLLGEALHHHRVKTSLAALAPSRPAYRVLRDALKRYEQMASSGTQMVVASGPSLKHGDRGPRVEQLHRRLKAAGVTVLAQAMAGDTFSDATAKAVMFFQRKSGLEPDGVVGPATLRELNRSPAERVAQIKANLERWRWLPDDLGFRHIRVNIAAYELEAWAKGKVEKTHDVIVGRAYRKTPVFSGQMSYLVLNPWWEVPRSIARLDKLADFQKDPGLPERAGFDIYDNTGKRLDPSAINWAAYNRDNFPFRLRQRPGPLNALGEVKLMFPNRYNVYLHGTPLTELFSKVRRDFSSGCIRVHRVRELVAWVMAGMAGWNRDRIEREISKGREFSVNLPENMPIHIFYMTAIPDGAGGIRFLPDIYNRDQRLILALSRSQAAR